jgi:hypothetical protein
VSNLHRVMITSRTAVQLLRSRPIVRCCCVFVWLLLAFNSTAQSTSQDVSLDDVVRQLADRITTIPNLRGPYRLEIFQNLAPESAKETQESFRKELEARHVTLSDDPTASVLHIGIAQTPTEIVLSASARINEKDEVRLLTFPRANFRTASLPVAPVRLEKQLVYQTPDRLLDASSLWNGSATGIALLVEHDAEFLVLRLDSAGAIQQSISLNSAGPQPSRDPRGELSLQQDLASVFFLGKACQFAWSAPAEAKCHAAKFTARANTVLTPSCDPGGWKLEANGSDWTNPDLLQLVPENATQKGSATIASDFPGPIVSINGDQNPSSALVVTRNLRTGNYEVYKITLACGN